MSTSPIDLTVLSAVKAWLGVGAATTSEDAIIQDCITAFSAYVLRATGRGPAGGEIPATSPFVTPVAYTEVYDGSGSERQPIRNWPITSVTSVTVNGIAIVQSSAFNVPGWVIDGDKKFISIRAGSGASYRGGGYSCGFANGVQNVEISYTAGFSGVPPDLEMMARKVVALNYKRKGWIGQTSQAMAAGAGTVSYGQWEMDAQDMNVLDFYKRRVA